MCGIAVVLAEDAWSQVDRMIRTLRHRGPDESGITPTLGNGAVGHTRLSIMDPAHGQQPFVSASGVVAISNGEIYNHEALRHALPEGSLDGLSGSDGEVILPLFAQ